MSDRPRFKQHYRQEVTPHGVLLLSERSEVALRGAAYLKVAPFLDGRHTTAEIVNRLEGELPEAEVLYAIRLLEQKGHVVADGGPCEGPAATIEQAAFWELLGATPAVVAERMAGTTVSVHAFGGAHAEPFMCKLESLGIRVDTRGDRWVALTDDYLQPGLGELDQEARRAGVPWMLVKPVGIELWLGPVFVPGQTGCWTCLAQRLAGHRKAEAYVKTRRGQKGPLVVARAALPSTVDIALGLAATEVARWVVEGRSAALEGRVISFDTASLTRRDHVLTRRPQCPSCGDPGMVAEAQRRPISLQRSPASFRAEGGYRRVRPEEMLARYEHHVSPITGLIGHVKRVRDRSGSELTPSYIADHNFANADDDRFFLREGMRSRSGGKGKSDAQARASVIGESLERWSGVFQGDEARIRATLEQLGSAGIHPNDGMLFSERQLAERDHWNRSGSRYTRVPEPFDPAAEIEWSPVFPLRGGEPRYLPTACCYFGYGNERDRRFGIADSNGCAAGMTKEEAILQGLLELCERDCTAMWWYCRVRRPGVDLASFGDPYYEELVAYYRSIHRSLWALDITNDLGIPTFAAVSHRTDKKAQDVVFGLGSHLDPKIALLRAVTELNQFLPAVIGVTAESEGYNFNDQAVQFWRTATLESDPYLAPDGSMPLRTLSNHPERATGDLHDDVLRCERSLAERGVETFVLDQTRPDTGMHVVRVIAPGLRHFWARFAPGRLYDVPVRMGWLPRPPGEHELNPISIFF
jgi:bacteriocin biosynthesis cyclodehydratase domain-containing protein